MDNVIDGSGYHVAVCQEAWPERMSGLDHQRWSFALQHDQFVGARMPSPVRALGWGRPKQTRRWLYAQVKFDEPRAIISQHGMLSLHINSIAANKPVASIIALGEVLKTATAPGKVDVVCGDINQARWPCGT